jgi:tetratricopeptide (TPR) repeat protein
MPSGQGAVLPHGGTSSAPSRFDGQVLQWPKVFTADRTGRVMIWNGRAVSMRVAVAASLAGTLLSAAADGQVLLPPGLGAPLGGNVPTERYDLAVVALADGDIRDALAIATDEYRGGVKAGTQRWIDSIASAMLVGECHWELGQFREAVEAYDQALLLSAAHANWLLAVQFPPQGPRPLQRTAAAPWGPGTRNVVPGALPEIMQIRIEGPDPQQVLQRGGVLAAPVNRTIRPLEIMRGLVVSLYRRGDILGELAVDGTSLEQASRALAARPALPNHYSQTWIDVALGVAQWAQGKPDAASPLLRNGLLMAQQFDHPLAAWALIVLGRISLAKDDAAMAARWFEEATLTAFDHGDVRAMEEAFRWALAAHAAAGTRGVPRSLAAATDWSRGGPVSLRARLLALSAEALAANGEPAAATATLSQIDPRLLRGDLGRTLTGAQASYASALASYAGGDVAAGDAEIVRAITIARVLSPRLFQTQRLVEFVLSGGTLFSDRQADLLFARLLADPSPREVMIDPLGSLAAASTTRADAFEAWASVAARRGTEPLMAAAEAGKRARWLDSQPLGGRRISIERLLSADPQTLSAEDAARRAAVLAMHPRLAKEIGDAANVRTRLSAALLAAAGRRDPAEALPGEPADWTAYRELADRRIGHVAAVSVGREPIAVDFPPLWSGEAIRKKLRPRQLLLSFHWNAAGLLAALESNERIATWQVRQPGAIARDIASLAKELCLFDPVAPVGSDKMVGSNWRLPAERIERSLFEQSRVALAEGIDELVIVPDGLLWYLPFELLPVGSGREAEEDRRPLMDCCRIRYAPTRSLAVMPAERGRPDGIVGIVAGRLHRAEPPTAGVDAVARLSVSIPSLLPIGGATSAARAAGTPAAAASLVDSLLVLEDLGGDAAIAARPLIASGGARGGTTFGAWLEPPPKRPKMVVLPGFQSAVASGLAKPPARPGDDLFIATTDLLAAGARTVLISRWRVGGRTTIDLVEEFLRDVAAGHPPSESWRRAVEVVRREPPDPSGEPRLKQVGDAFLTDASHPFFWAGPMLVECGGDDTLEAP